MCESECLKIHFLGGICGDLHVLGPVGPHVGFATGRKHSYLLFCGPIVNALLYNPPRTFIFFGHAEPAMRFPTSWLHLSMLAVAVAVAASRLVSWGDILFFLLSFPYVYFLSSLVFPASRSQPEPSVFTESEGRALGLYVLVGAVVGIVLPALYLVWGVREAGPAAGHLFLLAGQVVAEGATFEGGTSLPIRALVPVWFNSRRLFTIADWLRAELGPAGVRFEVGGWLAVANLVFWSFNLFAFLLPVFLPRALSIHYSKRSD